MVFNGCYGAHAMRPHMWKLLLNTYLVVSLALAICLTATWAVSVKELETGPEGVWKTYRYADGLAGSRVFAIMQDREGAIWFGTWGNGVSRFDGKSWKTYTKKDGLANNDIGAIMQDKEGSIWFGTANDGVSRFDGKSWRTFTAQNSGLGGNRVNAIIQDKEGTIWLATYGGGVSKFDGTTLKTYTQKDGLVKNQVLAMIQDKEGAIWFGTEGGVSRFDSKSWRNFTAQNSDLANNSVQAMLQDKEGAIWFGTSNGGVSRFDGKSWRNFTAQNSGLADNSVQAMTQDKEGAIWFGTEGGVSRFDGKSWRNFTAQNSGLADNSVQAMTQDKEGAIWFATEDGVSQFDDKSWKIYTQKDGLAGNDVRVIMQDKNATIWFGTWGGGVSQFDAKAKSWKTYTQKNGLADNYIFATMQDKEGAIWFGTNGGGVSKFDGVNWQTYTQKDGLADNHVLSVIQDKEGAIWFGTNGGVSRFDGKKWKTYTPNDGLASNSVFAMMQDKDRAIWFGTDNGVSRFDGKNWQTYTQKDGKDGLAYNFVNAIIQDKTGALWFGANGGVSRFDGKKWKTYTPNDGLAHDFVNAIIQDKGGTLWFGTNGGLSRFDNRCFQTINSEDGFPSNAIRCLYLDRNGQAWIGTDGGVVQFTPNPIPPPLYITQMIADESHTNPKGSIQLGSNIRRISFGYHAISFKTRPGGMKYFYQLVGKDADWQGPTGRENVEYFNLKPGKYTFKVQAVDRDLNYSKSIASLGITISSSPFYRSALFIIFLASGSFLIPTVIYGRLFIAQRRKAKTEREEFEPISNPYMAGGPVRSEEMFFGREEDFKFVSNKLKTEREGIVIVFYGQRRSGKTSILHQILSGRLGKEFMPMMIDMQEMAVHSDGEFYEKIADEMSFGLSEWFDINSVEYDFRSEGVNPALVFKKFIDDVMNKPGDKVLLLMFDEYELLEDKMDAALISRDTPTFLAGTLEGNPRISLIFTGSRHIDQRNPEYWSTLFGKSTARRISLLNQRDTIRLITEPVAEKVIYQKSVPERIYRFTGGQPFYTQHVCQLLIERLNELERNKVYTDDVEKAALELADNPPPQLMYFWNEELTAKERLALVLLGRVLEKPNRYATAKMVAEYAASREEDISLDEAEVARILDGLCEYELLERERISEEVYEYRYKIDLFRYWVQRHQSISRVMREL